MPAQCSNHRKFRPKLFHALLCIFVCPKACHCANTGDTCSLAPVALSSHWGSPTLDSCTIVTGEASLCGMLCSALRQCKAGYLRSCDANGQCTCAYCDKLTGVDFGINSVQFFLHTQEDSVIFVNVHHVKFPGQLVAGQPLIMKILLNSTMVTMSFYSTVGQNVFHTEIRFHEGSVVSNSYIGYRWGAEDRYTPHFNFRLGQELSVFCVVTSAGYQLYFDRVLFKNFSHRFPLSTVSDFVATDSEGSSKIISFQR